MNVSFAKKRHANPSLRVSANISVLFRRAALLAVTSSLVGCGMGSVSGTGSIAPAVSPASLGQPQISGKVHGGQFPVTGAYIQLYAVGTSGYGVGATPLIATSTASDSTTQSTVQTDSNGDFTITGQYTCPGSNPLVYLTAVGGNPGLTTGTNNTQIALVAALGYCNALAAAPSTFITVNEVTTVAAVWALQGFIGYTPTASLYANGGTYNVANPASVFSIGAPSTNSDGIANAFNVASVLADTSAGSSPGVISGTGTSGNLKAVESTSVNLLGNILSSCVNSAGGTSGTTNCGQLFGAVTPSTYYNLTVAASAGTPQDTIQAAYLIARNPGNNVATIAGLAPATGAPFQPAANGSESSASAFVSTFNDFTIAYSISPAAYNTALASPEYMAVDKYGNVWVSNLDTDGVSTTTPAAPYIPFLTEFDPLGNQLAKVSQYYVGGALQNIGSTGGVNQALGGSASYPNRIAIDASNNVYVADVANGNIFGITGSSGAGTKDAALFTTNAIATGITGLTAAPAWVRSISSLLIDSSSNLWLESPAAGSATFPSGKAISFPLSNVASGTAPSTTLSVSTGGNTFAMAIDNTLAANATGAPYVWISNIGNCTNASSGLGGATTIAYGDIEPLSSVAVTVASVLTYPEATFKAVDSLGVSTTSCTTANYPTSLATVMSSGTSTYVAPIAQPVDIGFDSSNGMWLLNVTDPAASSSLYSSTNDLSVTHLSPSYNAAGTTITFPSAGTAGATAVATGGNLGGVGTGGSGFNTSYPETAVDGSGNFWVPFGNTSYGVSEFSYNNSLGTIASVSPSGTGFEGNACSACTVGATSATVRGNGGRRSIVVDRSGNVWSPNSSTPGNFVTIIVGAATPVSTPLLPGTEGFRP